MEGEMEDEDGEVLDHLEEDLEPNPEGTKELVQEQEEKVPHCPQEQLTSGGEHEPNLEGTQEQKEQVLVSPL